MSGRIFDNFNHANSVVSFEQPIESLHGLDVGALIQKALLPPGVVITSILADPDRSKSHASHNLRVVTSDEGDLQKILLKYNPRMQDRDHVERITLITDYLCSQGVPAPEVLRNNSNGRPYTLIPSEGKELLFVAYRFVEGQYFSGTIEELEQARNALGQLHRALASYEPDEATLDQGQGSWRAGDSTGVLDDVEHMLRNNDDRDEFDVYTLRNMDEFRGHLERSGSNELSVSPRQLIHDDFHVQNVLFKNSRVELIVDFEDIDAIPAPRVWDIAFALHRFVKFYSTRNTELTEDDATKIGSERFLAGYRSGNQDLKDEEVRAIPMTIRSRAAMAIVENLKYRYQLRTLNPPVAELKKHMHTFEEAKLFDFLVE